MSFDADNENTPIPYSLPADEWHNVNVFRIDGAGYSVSIRPPTGTEVGGVSNFIMLRGVKC